MSAVFPTYYDYVTHIGEIIRGYLEEFGRTVTNVLLGVGQLVVGGMTNLIVSPVTSAIQGLFNFIWTSIANIMNSAFQSIINFIWENIINPIKGVIQIILNRIYERFEGLVYIAITIHPLIYEIRKFIDKPKFESILSILAKPLIGYLGAKLITTVASPYLRPVTIPITPPPEAPKIPLPKEITIDVYDMLPISDYTTIGLAYPVDITDTIPIMDNVIAEIIEFPEWLVTDTLPISDSVEVETPYHTLEQTVTDTLEITDSAIAQISSEYTIELTPIDTLPISDSVEVEVY